MSGFKLIEFKGKHKADSTKNVAINPEHIIKITEANDNLQVIELSEGLRVEVKMDFESLLTKIYGN